MTIRRPNRRHVPEIETHVRSTYCPASGKRRYVEQRVAILARDQTAAHDPDPARGARLHVFRCSSCSDWHVGHVS